MTANTSDLAVSVVIPTHNPRMDFLRRVLDALRVQALPREQWELLVVDNGSRVPLKAGAGQRASGSESSTAQRDNGSAGPQATAVDLSWHPSARIVREEKLGLTFARLRGFAEAKGELIVMVDDDNVLAADYLETAVRIAQERPGLGAFGGKCLPEFEVKPDLWLEARGKGLGLRDRGEREEFFPEAAVAEGWQSSVSSWRSEENGRRTTDGGKPSAANRQRRAVREFPDCAPIGAGMVLRRDAAAAYAERMAQRACGIRHTAYGEEGASVGQSCGRAVGKPELPKDRNTATPNHRAASVITDRRGDSLASGGDNDICLTVVEEGWQVGYLPELKLTHLIPKGRMTLDYQRRMARDAVRSYLLMLDQHGIRPHSKIPRWSVPLRIAKDFVRVKPWRSPEASLEWHGHIGQYLARAELAWQNHSIES